MFRAPCYSQYLDVKNSEWKRKSCGIVALKMILDYWAREENKKIPDIDELVKIGLNMGAYINGIGWKHKALVQIAKQYGFKGRNFDWRADSAETALAKMTGYLKLYPIMASVYKNFDLREGGHLITLIGMENNEIFYNEPMARKREDIAKKMSLAEFLKGWKRRIIIVYK